jgi:hypothetical protein
LLKDKIPVVILEEENFFSNYQLYEDDSNLHIGFEYDTHESFIASYGQAVDT